jgi:hypothetical protein
MSITYFDDLNPAAVQRARAAARRVGWRVKKARSQRHYNQRGGLMLVDERNVVVDGRDFDLTPEMVEEIIDRAKAHARKAV